MQQKTVQSVGNRPGLVAATMVTLAWGALAFGANYPWAYIPLLAGWAAIGILGLARPASPAYAPWPVAAGLVAIAIGTLLQLVPLPPSVLQTVSPAAYRFLQGYDLNYALTATTTGVSHALSIAPSRTWLALAFLGSLGLLLVGTARMLTRGALRLLSGSISALAVVLTIIAIVQKAMWNGKIFGFWTPLMEGSSPFGPFVNKNHFAGWMLMALPLTLGLFVGQADRGMNSVRPAIRSRLLWFSSVQASQAILLGFASLVMGLGLVLTFSRSGIIGFVVAVLIAAGMMLRRQTSAARRGVTMACAVLLPLAIASWVGIDAIIGRFTATDSATLSGRALIWQDTWRIATDFAPFGSGLNTYGYATLIYQSAYPRIEHLREAHNDYLQLATEGGWLLCAPIAITIVLFAREVHRRFRESERVGTGYWIRVGAVTGLVAIATQSVWDFSLQMPGNAGLFAVLCGIALHQAGRAKTDATTR